MVWGTAMADLSLREVICLLTDPSTIARLAVLVAALLAGRAVLSFTRTPAAVHFAWPAPKARDCRERIIRPMLIFQEAELDWAGQVIADPSLDSHERDRSLLPPEAGHTGSDRRYLTCYDPSTAVCLPRQQCQTQTDVVQYHLDTIPLLSSEEITAQIQKAHEAQPSWKQTSFQQRQHVLRSLRSWILRDMEAICRVACRDTGKTRECVIRREPAIRV